ncbi:MAG TPA: DUF4097 family beta strand repeat-containing protein [Gaiellaceae bacterium]|jgi:hypothetical protein|nr:DUF4097 family beta strand repeat-containing protein [Gaiellaceae bacterium]
MAEHSFHTPLPLALEVSIPAGDIEVETVDGEESTIVVEGDEQLVHDTRVSHDGNRLLVEFKGRKGRPFGLVLQIGSFNWGQDGIRVRARVPHGAAAKLSTASADLTLAGRVRSLEVKTASGDVEIRGEVEESATVKTVSGDVELDRVGADLSVNTVSGDVRAGFVGGSSEVRSVSGDIRLDAVREGRASFTSVSGDVEVGIAQGSFLDVDAGSTSGDLSSEVPLASDRSGDGDGPTVVVRGKTISGDVRIFRAA